MSVSQNTPEAKAKPKRRPPRDPMIGSTIGEEFEVEFSLGSGGMGSVYRAKQRVTDRKVAIKVLHRHLIHQTVIDRFEQEAQIASRLNHPNIVTVYKFGELDDGGLYIAMEFIDGRPLGELIDTGAFKDVKRALPLMIQMAEALACAHDERVVHRDIKPGNIVVTKIGRKEAVKVLDFGIAKAMDDSHIVTQTGMLCGSPEYMSPEQWRQYRDIDGRSDIYSLGCVFYAMLTARAPFEAGSVPGYMMAHVGKEAPRLDLRVRALAQLPQLTGVIRQCMAKDREDRFSDAYALVEALRACEPEVLAHNPAALDEDRHASRFHSEISGSPTLADTRVPGATDEQVPSPLSFLDDLSFDDDDAVDRDDKVADDLGAVRRKHSKVDIASPGDIFDIDVTHTGPQGLLHRMLLAVGVIQLAFLASAMLFLSLYPPNTEVPELESAEGDATDSEMRRDP